MARRLHGALLGSPNIRGVHLLSCFTGQILTQPDGRVGQRRYPTELTKEPYGKVAERRYGKTSAAYLVVPRHRIRRPRMPTDPPHVAAMFFAATRALACHA